MTYCKYILNRYVPISICQSSELFKIDRNFHIVLIKRGSLRCIINNTHCFVNSRSVLLLSQLSKFKFLYSNELDMMDLFFAPEFINVNLNWSVIQSTEYPALCRDHHYPSFKLFYQLNNMYLGILNLNDELYTVVENLMTQIQTQLYDQPDLRWSCRARSCVFKLFSQLEWLYQEYFNGEETDHLFMQVCNYIITHLDEDLSIDVLCRKFATNHTTIFYKFKEYAGIPISSYILEKRLDSAKNDLTFTNLPLAEIAKNNGFRTASYFTRVFKQSCNLTPLKYRQFMRENRPNKTHCK